MNDKFTHSEDQFNELNDKFTSFFQEFGQIETVKDKLDENKNHIYFLDGEL